MFKSVLRLATGALLMAAALGASAASSSYQDFSVSGVFQEVVGIQLRCPTKIGGTMTGYGSSATFGRVVFLGGDCVTPGATLNTFSDGRFILTALTGEMLFANYSGQAVLNADASQYTFTGGTFQVTGGTGKYAGATGGGTMAGSENAKTFQGQLQLSGRLLLKN